MPKKFNPKNTYNIKSIINSWDEKEYPTCPVCNTNFKEEFGYVLFENNQGSEEFYGEYPPAKKGYTARTTFIRCPNCYYVLKVLPSGAAVRNANKFLEPKD